MTKFLPIIALTAAFAAPASAATTAPVGAATPATATAQIVDPLSLTKTQDLSFGTLIKMTGMAASHVVSIDEADAVTCTAELLCGGTTKSAKFDVAGSANQLVKVYVAPTTMFGPGSAILAFTPSAASTSPLTLSGTGGASFAIGGSITVAPTTASGVYVGDMDVTVDYN
ncbi:MAG: DUF4402 domain-containing protein [Sphingomicrobium sp.]